MTDTPNPYAVAEAVERTEAYLVERELIDASDGIGTGLFLFNIHDLRAVLDGYRTILADRQASARREEELLDDRSSLFAAINWLEPPFIDANTKEPELRARIGFMLDDAGKVRARQALRPHEDGVAG